MGGACRVVARPAEEPATTLNVVRLTVGISNLARRRRNGVFACAFALWALAAVFAAAPRAQALETPWWDTKWKIRRKLTVNTTPSGFPGDDVAYAVFLVGDHAKPDGSDIRVVAGRKPVPFTIVFKGRAGTVTIAWKKLPRTATYHAYFGNPNAGALKETWQPKRGLLLETRRFRSGNPSNLSAMRYIIRKNTEVMGRSFVDRIFYGYNPHGPSVNNINIFTGYLNCPISGRYEFYTSSDDASFLLIDGRLVVQWPGWHGPIARARFKGVLNLKKGLHKLEYLHVQGGNRQIMAAYWRPPGRSSIEVIPASAFSPVSRAHVGWMKTKSGRFVPDFWPSNKGEAVLGDHDDVFLIKMHFDNRSPAAARRFYRSTWDFGDGTKQRAVSPEHVYLASGTYKVTLTMSKGKLDYETTSWVVVDRDWKHLQTARKIDKLADYYPLVKDYPLDAMDPRSIHNAAWMFQKLGRTEKMAEAVRVLLKTARKVPDSMLIQDVIKLEELLLEKKKAAEALDALAVAERRAAHVATKAQLAVRRARIMINHTGDAAGAKKEAQKVLDEYAKAKPETLRWARILLGDAAGKLVTTSAEEAYAAALAEYEKAEAIKTNIKFRGRFDEVAIPSLSRSIEDYLRRNELELCEKLLDEWEFRKPTDKLVGYYTLLRAQWWLQKGRSEVAAELLQSLIEINPASTYGDQALWKLADCYAAERNYEKADEALDSIAKLFPESALVTKVADRKKEIRRPKTVRRPPRPVVRTKRKRRR